MAKPVYRARLVEMDGTVIETFDAKVICENATFTLNESDDAALAFPKRIIFERFFGPLTAVADDDGPMLAEVQIIDTANSDKLIFWGPVIAMNGAGSDGAVHMKAAGVDWYLFRRFLDGTVTQYLSNEDFENDLTDWTDETGGSFAFDTNRFFTGTQALRVTGAGGDSFANDNFVTQSVDITAGPLGLALVLSGWFWIGTSGYNPAIEGRGLYVETLTSPGAVLVTNNFYVLDSATPRGKWVKAQTSISIPPSTTYTVSVRAYAGSSGNTWWDDIKLVQFDSFGFVDITGDEDVAADVGDFLCHLVDSVQNTAFGKSDLNIDTDNTTIGQKTMQTYFFSDHVQFDQAIEGYLSGSPSDGGQDYAILYDADAGTRTFTNYATRGTDRSADSDFTLVFSTPGGTNFALKNCSDYRWTQDGANCITNQTVLGDDSGPDREEAIVDFSAGVAGLTLQDVRQSPQNTEVKRLLSMADARVNIFGTPPISLEMDVKADAAVAMIGTLAPGDRVTAIIESEGYFSTTLVWRVHQIKLNFITGVLTVVLSRDGT